MVHALSVDPGVPRLDGLAKYAVFSQDRVLLSQSRHLSAQLGQLLLLGRAAPQSPERQAAFSGECKTKGIEEPYQGIPASTLEKIRRARS